MAEPSSLAENRTVLIAAGVGVLLFLLIAGLMGFGGAVGVVGFAVYAAVWLAVAAFVLWLLYRFVVAVEEIASAQQRIAAAQNSPAGTQATTNRTVEGEENETTSDRSDDESDRDAEATDATSDDAESDGTAPDDTSDDEDAA